METIQDWRYAVIASGAQYAFWAIMKQLLLADNLDLLNFLVSLINVVSFVTYIIMSMQGSLLMGIQIMLHYQDVSEACFVVGVVVNLG